MNNGNFLRLINLKLETANKKSMQKVFVENKTILLYLRLKASICFRSLNNFCYISIIVPTFDTKVTEYLCSGWVFFSDKF